MYEHPDLPPRRGHRIRDSRISNSLHALPEALFRTDLAYTVNCPRILSLASAYTDYLQLSPYHVKRVCEEERGAACHGAREEFPANELDLGGGMVVWW